MRRRKRNQEITEIVPERSTLLVPDFPRALRLRIKALANLRDQKMHEVIEELLQNALQTVEDHPAQGA